MTHQFQTSFRKFACTLAVAASLTAWASASFAFTAEQEAACKPDAFRLCSSEIPNVDRIAACLRRKQASLSPACKATAPK